MSDMTFRQWAESHQLGDLPDTVWRYAEAAWQAAQKAEIGRSEILKHALDELLLAKRDSEKGAGWDHSRSQRVWREANEAIAKYDASESVMPSHAVLIEALLIIAGKKQCLDNLMSDKDIAISALAKYEGETDDHAVRQVNQDLIERLDAEPEKPEPIECGWVAIVNGVLTNCWNNPDLPEGTHKLLAVRIDDEQKI